MGNVGVEVGWRSGVLGVTLGAMSFDQSHVEARIRRSAEVLASLGRLAPAIAAAGAALREAVGAGGTIYACGNGGSAAQSLHFVEELLGKYKRARRAFPAVCLAADPTSLTCIANDFGFEHVFSRQVEALVGAGDVLVVLSTSGGSENVVRALAAARERGALTIALLGRDGGRCRAMADHAIVVSDEESETIQECHQLLLHLMVEAVESLL